MSVARIRGDLETRVQRELFRDVAHVTLDGMGRAVEPLRDFLVTHSLANQLDHFALAPRHAHVFEHGSRPWASPPRAIWENSVSVMRGGSTLSPAATARIVATNSYTPPDHVDRSGWSWYTGAASWSYRVALEGILGFDKRGERLRFDSCIPAGWPELTLDYRFGSSTYAIRVSIPSSRGVDRITLDDVAIADE